MKSYISIVRCKNYDPSLVEASVRKVIDLLGGITNFVKPKSKVLVKPNLLMAKEPEFGIDTHPEVVRSVIKILKEINCQVFLGDGPSVWGRQIEDVDEVYEKSGMKKVAEEEAITLVKFNKRKMYGEFPLASCLAECDYLINLPKFKTHDLTILTGAIKNLFGLVVGTYKTELHRKYPLVEEFSSILVDIYAQVKPALTLVDGIVAMEADGPATGGKLRNLGLLLASCDCVALDSVLALIMGLKPQDILTTKEAAKRNLGIANIDQIEILGEKLEEIINQPFQLPTPSILRKKIPRPIIELGKKLIRFYPKIDYKNCTLCQACIQACPSSAINFKNKRIIINYSKCISCFCCQEACRFSAIKVGKSIFTKMIGL